MKQLTKKQRILLTVSAIWILVIFVLCEGNRDIGPFIIIAILPVLIGWAIYWISRAKPQADRTKKMSNPRSRGKTQISIGIIVGILLLVGTGTKLLSVYTEYNVMQNENLLIELGYDPADFQYSPAYWIERFAFHAFGLAVILLYVIFVASKKLRGAQIGFLLCLLYFLVVTYSNITSLSEEQQMRGYTVAGWIGRIVSWLLPLAIWLGLLIQGLLGLHRQACKTSESTTDTGRIVPTGKSHCESDSTATTYKTDMTGNMPAEETVAQTI